MYWTYHTQCSEAEAAGESIRVTVVDTLLLGLLRVVFSTLFLVVLARGLVILGADALEDGKAALGGHSDVEVAHIRVGDLVDSRFHDGSVLVKKVLVASSLVVEIGEVSSDVAKLTAHSILAVALTSGVRFAEGHAVLAGNMSLLDELFLTVSERAVVTELAVLAVAPELANFGLLLLLVGRLEIVMNFVNGRRHESRCRRFELSEGGLEGGSAGLELGHSGLEGHGSEEALSFGSAEKFISHFRLIVVNLHIGSGKENVSREVGIHIINDRVASSGVSIVGHVVIELQLDLDAVVARLLEVIALLSLGVFTCTVLGSEFVNKSGALRNNFGVITENLHQIPGDGKLVVAAAGR
jgi:hypothetical protein